ncbi:MAG: xylulokinase [Actinomycetota bacterium]
MSVVLGLDISTTATKALLMEADGRLRGTAAVDYPTSSPRTGWSEQDPALWWTAAIESIREVLATSGTPGEAVEAVGLAGQMHGLVLLAADQRVLRPAILWNDQRTTAECDEIRAEVGAERLLEITGNDALTGFTAPKLLWVRRHEPDVWEHIAHVLLPKDSVRLHLSGDLATDCADGAGTLLMDLAQRDWSPAILECLQIPRGWLPTTVEGPDPTGAVSPEAAAATGLRSGTPIVGGGGDQAAAAVGVGAVAPDVLSVSLGTSGVVFASTEGPIVEPEGRLHAFCHAVPDRWHLMGVMLSAAGSLRWYRDTLAPNATFWQLMDEAATVPRGCDGLTFLPYLTGERTPHPDPLARGAFVGLTARHTRAHLTRAVLEGVAFGLRDSLELLQAMKLAAHAETRLTGGGSRSAVWRQIIADVLATPVASMESAEGAAFGAAMLASVGAGWHASVDDAVGAAVRVEGLTDVVDADAYEPVYHRFRALYPALAPTFHMPS